MTDADGLQSFRIVELPHLYLRHHRKKGPQSHSWDFGWSRAIFSVATAEERDIVPAFRVRLLGRTHEIVSVRGTLYRQVLDAGGMPALISDLERAEPDTLLDDANDAWTDHCSFVDRSMTAPEEPAATASLGPDLVRFKSLVGTQQFQSRSELQERLDRCLAIGDRLWAPTAPPGLVVSRASGRASAWIPGLRAVASTGLRLPSPGWSSRIDRIGARTAIKRHREYSHEPADPARHASIANVEWALRGIVSNACPTVAALGQDIATLFWTGRHCLALEGGPQLRNWLEMAPEVLIATGLKDLVQTGRILAQEYDQATSGVR